MWKKFMILGAFVVIAMIVVEFYDEELANEARHFLRALARLL